MVVEAQEIRLAPIRRAPNMDDARKAAEVAATHPRVEQVLVFGSVARGDASEWSDIDLLVLIGDVSNKEWGDASHEIRSDVNHACADIEGKPIDVIVQRRADFEYLSANVSASFEHVAWGDAVLLYQSSPDLMPARGKVNGVPRDNLALAAEHVKSACRNVDNLQNTIDNISAREARMTASPSNTGRSIENLRENRYSKLLEEGHMVIELSFRSAASSSEGLSLGKGHEIGDYISMMGDTPERAALAEAVDPLRRDNKIRTWRLASYTGHIKEWAAETTAENASAHIDAALTCSRVAIEAVESRAGENQSLLDTMVGTREALTDLENSPRSPAELESGPATPAKRSRRGLKELFRGSKRKRDQQFPPSPDTSQHVVGLPVSHDELVEAGAIMSGGSGGKCGHPTPDGDHKTCQNPHPGAGGTCSGGHQR